VPDAAKKSWTQCERFSLRASTFNAESEAGMPQSPTSKLDRLNRLTGFYCLACIAIITWPASAIMVGVVVFVRLAQRRRQRLTTLGSARWAEERDLRRAGMIGANSGLILGRTPSKKKLLPFAGNASAWNELIRLPQAIHTSIFAPTGAGKGVSLIAPFLFTCEESCVVLDFKGELARLTAQYRRDMMGHQIGLLDPYRMVIRTPDRLNPLDAIGKDHPLAIDDCNDLANALVVRTGQEHEPHWNDSAEAVIAAVSAVVVGYGEPDMRSLMTVREIISNPQRLELAIKLMTESDKWKGALGPMGGQLMQFADKEKASVLSSTLRHLRFLGTPAIAESVATSSFDPGQLRRGRMTVYLILPPDRARAQSGLLRMWVGSLLRACVRGGLQ
jgi:type IV secretion system protein VirD4